MFSSRTRWNLKTNPLAECLAERRRLGLPVLDLSESNPTRAGIDYPRELLLSALRRAENLRYDPQAHGSAYALQAVVEYYGSRNVRLSPDNIFLTSGTSEAYAHLFRLLGDPGDRFLIPQPGYPLFEFLAGMESVLVDSYPSTYHGRWSIDFEELTRRLHPNTRAILLVHPNNPTGSYLCRSDEEQLMSLCRKHGLALVIDEVFFDYDLNRPQDAVLFSDGAAGGVLTFLLNGLSKICALPQMKLAWIAMSGPPEALAQARERLELIHDTFLSVCGPIQNAAFFFLSSRGFVQKKILERLRSNLRFLHACLQDSPAHTLPVEGGWYAATRVPQVLGEEAWALGLLREHGVVAHPGYFFDFPGEAYLITSLLTEEEIFREGIRRFRAYLTQVAS